MISNTVRGMTGKLDRNFSRAEHSHAEGKTFHWATFPCQQEHVKEGKLLKFNYTQGMCSSILLAKVHINGAKSKL